MAGVAPPAKVRLVAAGMMLLLALAFGLGILSGRAGDAAVRSAAGVPGLPECIRDTLGTTRPETIDLGLLQAAGELCYRQINAQGLLDDARIRQLKFSYQHDADRALLWMVVAITLSGVCLAGLQLGASYKLALLRGEGDLAVEGALSVERDRIALKSTVTGLFILLISFAFFFIYVRYVYKIDEVSSSTYQSCSTAPVSAHAAPADAVSAARGPPGQGPQLPAGSLAPAAAPLPRSGSSR